MKKLLLLITLFIGVSVSAQIVNIPDANFKNVLVNTLCVDTDGDFQPDSDADINDDGEIQYSEAEAVEYLEIFSGEIYDLSGIEAFINLSRLNIQDQFFSTIDVSQMTNLEVLGLWNNTNLEALDVTDNTLLWDLWISSSELITEIDLSQNLNLLNLRVNTCQLNSLDVFNNLALRYLDLVENRLTEIDVTNNINLDQIKLRNNQLTNIDVSQNVNLMHLSVLNNSINNIDVSQNLALEALYINNPDITNLDVTNNVNLRSLNIYETGIASVDLTNNINLGALIIFSTPITSVDISIFPDLETLSISNTGISTLDVSSNFNLSAIKFKNTLLTEIDFSNNPLLTYVNGRDNFQLEYVNLKNGANTEITIFNVTNSPNLNFVCVDDINYAITNFTDIDPLTTFIENCAIANGDINRIQGIIRYDDENDGCDSGDLLLENIFVNTTDGTNNFGSASNELGFYNLNVVENTYSTTILGFPPYFTITPNEEIDTFAGFNQTEIADFCITPNATANDLTVSLVPTNEARPGFDANYQLVYENVGTTQLNGTIVLEFDETRVSFNESVPAPISQTSSTITWDFGTINPFETVGIFVEFNLATPPTNESGDILNYTATINPIAGDETPDDNVFQLNQTIVNSYDPNDKTVLQGHQVLIENADDYLHYVIRFQNLGTASAINVRVQDELDELLDWTSFKVLESSHDMEVQIINKQIDFIFNDINLPSETTDPEGSNGFIVFKIKPTNGINLDDTIENTAYIYFDFNAAIITNTVSTTFVDELSIEDFNEIEVILYPNPLSETLTISISDNVIFKKAIVYSLLGEKLLESSEKKVNFSNFPSGIYFVTIETDQGSVIKRIIKE